MHILIAPNAFKNSLAADEVANAIVKGIQQSRLSCTTTCFPVGDGGDGTGKLLTKLLGGSFINAETSDPLGRKITASFGLIDDRQTAVIEMAAASGLHLLHTDELDPLHAYSYGTGLQIKQALDTGVKKIILCVGGSATVDGGCGILQALGVRFLDAKGIELSALPATLINLASVDISGLDARVATCEYVVLCDVANTLLGNQGAATIFGPQKGASAVQVQQLEACLTQYNNIVLQDTGIDMAGKKYGGAAGGTAAGLCAFLKAQMVNGIDYFLSITDFDAALKETNLVITGEGSIDLQTLEGKGPFGVAIRARQKNIPVIALAGKVPLQYDAELEECFTVLLSIGHEPATIPDAMRVTRENLTRTARQLGNLLAISSIESVKSLK